MTEESVRDVMKAMWISDLISERMDTEKDISMEKVKYLIDILNKEVYEYEIKEYHTILTDYIMTDRIVIR